MWALISNFFRTLFGYEEESEAGGAGDGSTVGNGYNKLFPEMVAGCMSETKREDGVVYKATTYYENDPDHPGVPTTIDGVHLEVDVSDEYSQHGCNYRVCGPEECAQADYRHIRQQNKELRNRQYGNIKSVYNFRGSAKYKKPSTR